MESFLSTNVQPAKPRHADRPTPSVPAPEAATGPRVATVVLLDSRLTVPGATGQIIVNGSESYIVAAGPTRLTARGQPRTNRVEALLVEGSGQAGQWCLDLQATRLPEGLRVLVGRTVSVSSREAVFALSGRPGERIVVTFQLPGAP